MPKPSAAVAATVTATTQACPLSTAAALPLATGKV
jgi:hypothetical protein